MKRKKLSVIIIARNEEKVIKDCLESVKWVDEIIFIDTGSIDRTPQIAQRYATKLIKFPFKGLEYARWRNRGLKEARGDWVLYLDADERITPELKKEIQKVIKGKDYVVYEIPRRNFYLGKEVRYGGAWPDYVKRLFLKDKLRRWERRLHEDPVFAGEVGRLENPMFHITHRDLSSMIKKTSEWSKIEAKLLDEAGHPPVTWWRVLRMILSELWYRGVRLQGLRGGAVGWIVVIFQAFSRATTYIQLWEIQQKK